MKRSYLFIAFILVFTSCTEKSYNCSCKDDNTGKIVAVHTVKGTHHQAKKECDDYSSFGGSINNIYSQSCSLD